MENGEHHFLHKLVVMLQSLELSEIKVRMCPYDVECDLPTA